MNNTINIKRLARLIIYENKSNGYIYNIAAVSIALLIIVFGYRAIFVATGIDETFRLLPIFGNNDKTVQLILILSPFIFYGTLPRKHRRATYLLLPASDAEKYLSMLVNTFVIVPFTITFAKICLDSIAAGFSATYIASLTETTELLNSIMLIWGGISIIMFFIIMLCRYKAWIAIALVVAIAIIETKCIDMIFKTTSQGYLTPSSVSETYLLASIINIVLFQILIYYNIGRIEA